MSQQINSYHEQRVGEFQIQAPDWAPMFLAIAVRKHVMAGHCTNHSSDQCNSCNVQMLFHSAHSAFDSNIYPPYILVIVQMVCILPIVEKSLMEAIQ